MICNSKELREALTACMAATGREGPLTNVHAVIDRNSLLLQATDRESSLSVKIDVEADGYHRLMWPPKRLAAILGEATSSSVEFVIESETDFTVRYDGARYRLATESPDKFPALPAFSHQDFVRVPGLVLHRAIQRTSFATDVQSVRYALGGVLFEIDGDKLTCAATDARRLAVVNLAAEVIGESQSRSVVVPTKLLRLLDRLPDADVDIAVDEKSVFFRSGGFSCSGRLVEGRFPRYRDVIPSGKSSCVRVAAGVLHSAVRQAMIVTTDEERGVDFWFAGNSLQLASGGKEVGTSEVRCDIEADTGLNLRVNLDPRYVADMMKVVPSENVVEIFLRDSDTAVLFRDGESYRYVIMPLVNE